MEHAFWKGRRVFVTGHTGFKGSWLSLWLGELGADVHGYSLDPPSRPSLFEEARIAETMAASVRGDIRDIERLEDAMSEAGPSVVFHLAAQALVRPSYDDPVETMSTNVMGTVHVLEACRRQPGVEAVVVVTSDKCYENREWIWPYRESDALGGKDPYSASKGCAEIVAASWARSFFTDDRGTALASARAGNVIGGGDWGRDRLVPDLVRGALAREAVHIRRPDAVRPWQHVLEPLGGYLLLAESLVRRGREVEGAWNFGPRAEDARPVGWVVEQLERRWQGALRWTHDAGPHPAEAGILRLDASKARLGLGWEPRLELATALDWIVEWTTERARREDPREITLRQIRRFQKLGPIVSNGGLAG